MGYLVLYWSFLAVGLIIAIRLKKRGIIIDWAQTVLMLVVYVLCLLMGFRMGVNEQVIANMGTIGIMSLILSVLCIAGSMAGIFAVRKVFGLDRFGDSKSDKAVAHVLNDSDSTKSEEGVNKEKIDLKSTVIIIILVVGGMAAGYLLIFKIFPGIIEQFNSVTETALVVLLCILLLLVGLDLGSAGSILEDLKKVGIKVIFFPIAAMLGTAIIGAITCLIMGFSLREGLAVSLGFGWYTYAPVVIAGAGQQYMIASALSFMYNVIRETLGIILIPIVAKKIGYIETTGIPGVAAMDVCMPIVDRSCRPDTVVYSFVTGFFMCITVTVAVPLLMGV